ncbi:hypothetical protein N0V92_013696 [Colletotrichum tropicale]|nr:hypothetical protein N0V92_013696 [Colletotrichum tropicale]
MLTPTQITVIFMIYNFPTPEPEPQYIAQPPLALTTCPLTHAASSPANHPTILATSSTVPTLLPTGVCAICISTISLGIFSSISLCTGPGATQFTVVPLPPNSRAQHRVNPSSAAFDEQYSPSPANPARAPTEEMLMMRARELRCGSRACVSRRGARTLRS